MNGLADLGWALLSLCLAGCFLAIIAADHAELRRRFSQAARLLSEAGPWLAAWLARKIRGEFAAPSPAHPAARAMRRCSPVSAGEKQDFRLVEFMLTAGVETAEPEYKTPRGEA